MRKMKKETVENRVAKIAAVREEFKKDLASHHVKLQRGNSKTGQNVYTVSLLPVLDCANCGQCKFECYDLKSDLIYKAVVNDRARNSAIHMMDPERYWNEIDVQVKAKYATLVRINVGGDLTNKDFYYVAELGRNNPKTMFLFFTKNFYGINKFLDENEFPENVKPIMSAWKGMKMDNPHNLPCSHVLYEDGETTAPEYGAYYCGGNCSACAFKEEGCWNLKNGEHVIFKAH